MKVVIFDWGNVLLNGNTSEYTIFDARKDIVKELHPKNESLLLELFDIDEFWTTEGDKLNDLIQKYLALSGCDYTVEDFKNVYLKYYRKVPWFKETVDFFNKLSSMEGVDIAVFSVLCEMDKTLLNENLPMDKVKYNFFSFNVGLRKTHEQFYKIISTVTGRKGEDIIFFDDSEENIANARKAGWNAIQVTGNDFFLVQDEIVAHTGIHFSTQLE